MPETLTERDKQEIRFAQMYSTQFGHGTAGHNRLMVIAKLADRLESQEPVCPRCKEQMVRTHYQDADGHWFVCWLCGCEPDSDVLDRAP